MTPNPASCPSHEGFVPFRGYRTWYRSVGETAPGKLPVLLLHGGPGATHDYLEPLAALAETGRQVVFYDQLGNGKSDHPDDPSLWTVELFLDELRTLVRELGLRRFHLLGQSWGGMLGMEYARTQPEELAGLVIANSPASMRRWVEEGNRFLEALPPETAATLREHEAAGTTDDPAYQAALAVFYARHLCRLDPWPECLMRSVHQMMQNPQVYLTMNGPSEFCVTGNLKEWDIRSRLGEIRVPALLLSGEWDGASPAICEEIRRGIPGSEWVLFEGCSHNTHLEAPERFLSVVDEFLTRVEHRVRRAPGRGAADTGR